MFEITADDTSPATSTAATLDHDVSPSYPPQVTQLTRNKIVNHITHAVPPLEITLYQTNVSPISLSLGSPASLPSLSPIVQLVISLDDVRVQLGKQCICHLMVDPK